MDRHQPVSREAPKPGACALDYALKKARRASRSYTRHIRVTGARSGTGLLRSPGANFVPRIVPSGRPGSWATSRENPKLSSVENGGVREPVTTWHPPKHRRVVAEVEQAAAALPTHGQGNGRSLKVRYSSPTSPAQVLTRPKSSRHRDHDLNGDYLSDALAAQVAASASRRAETSLRHRARDLRSHARHRPQYAGSTIEPRSVIRGE